ncbi:hypothetical protein HZS_6450 [Henneguya salminicola]|nr:hypothetical protein HZS_6450 [Henneguya salminicola]
MLWTIADCFSLMRYNGHTFIDGMFKCTYAFFNQRCIVIFACASFVLYVFDINYSKIKWWGVFFIFNSQF